MSSKAKILDLAGYLPPNTLTNADLELIYPDWPAEKIYDKTGIKKRHIASQDQTSVDLAIEAAESLFRNGKVAKDSIDFLIFCTQTPDYILPTSACLIQERLHLSKNIGAFDINLGCSGFVYGLSVAKGLIDSGLAKCVLLITADTYSKYIHPMDKSVRTIFGDGSAATVIGITEIGKGKIGPFIFGTDGSGGKNLIIESGSNRSPIDLNSSIEYKDTSGNIRSKKNIFMDGPEIMRFSLEVVPKSIHALCIKAKINLNDLDFLILHQGSGFMLEALKRKLKLDGNKFPICIQDTGNTVSSTIPFVLLDLIKESKLKSGNKLALVGFGVGYSWAACMIEF